MSKDDANARKARADQLREQIEGLSSPRGFSEPGSPKEEPPRDFVRRRMEEIARQEKIEARFEWLRRLASMLLLIAGSYWVYKAAIETTFRIEIPISIANLALAAIFAWLSFRGPKRPERGRSTFSKPAGGIDKPELDQLKDDLSSRSRTSNPIQPFERKNRVTLNTHCILSEYIANALDKAEYEKLEDRSYSGSIPACPGVFAFSDSLRDCERELRSVLEDWLLLGLKLGHILPVIGGIDLNKDMTHADVDSV